MLLEPSFEFFLTRNARRLPVERRGAKDLVVALKGVPWEPRQQFKLGQLRRILKSGPLPLPMAWAEVDDVSKCKRETGSTIIVNGSCVAIHIRNVTATTGATRTHGHRSVTIWAKFFLSTS